jgi:ABC-type multidrug transport system fused ATPase/permease subunit
MSDYEDIALEEQLEQRNVTWPLFRRLFSYAKPYRNILIRTMIATLLATASTLMGPRLIQWGIDHYLLKVAQDGLSQDKLMHGLLVVSGLYLGNLLLGWIVSVYQIRNAVRMGQGMMNDIRQAVFGHIQALSLNYFDRTHQGRILNRADTDIDSLDQILTWGANQMLGNGMTLVGVILLMAGYDLRLCAAASVVLVPLFIGTYLYQKNVMQAFREMRRHSSRLTAAVAEGVTGVRVVQAMAREEENLERFHTLHAGFSERAYNVAKIFHTYMPFLGIVYGIGMSILLGYGGTLALRHEITVGELAAFLLYLGMFFGPVQTMGELYNAALSAASSAERIFQLLDTPPQIVDGLEVEELTRLRGEVEFRSVCFRYDTTPPDRWILNHVSFRVEPGQTVALVGSTGSGKTSIISVLARFYEIQQGEILVDGHELRKVSVKSLHQQLGIVTQDNFLFTGTILENLKYGKPGATDDEVHQAARMLGAEAMITRWPEGYEKKVTERGSNFSAGERQLLCMVRALVADPRILILDEATSAVDSQTEKVIQHALEVLMERRTCFVIAHRLSTVVNADLILVLRQGEIVERGTHAELMKLDGVYAGLHDEFMAV